ncbi:hypothetical protein [Amycolatopsis sp. cg9]|uniref:hypothetical protein n=1 Tax=Amycolatopsis sp. cg9 TaxID=3238801 RepID=UPI003524239F
MSRQLKLLIGDSPAARSLDVELTEGCPPRHPATEAMLEHFRFTHLPPALREHSRLFGELVEHIADNVPGGPEKTAGLRKLLEAKDCVVRAALTE